MTNEQYHMFLEIRKGRRDNPVTWRHSSAGCSRAKRSALTAGQGECLWLLVCTAAGCHHLLQSHGCGVTSHGKQQSMYDGLNVQERERGEKKQNTTFHIVECLTATAVFRCSLMSRGEVRSWDI